MGTTTFYLKHNDLGLSLDRMSNEEIKKLSNFSPYREDDSYKGWKVPCELHNGNIYLLVFWKGRLMRLEEAIKTLNKKYYDKYQRKTLREYEWTVLKKHILSQVNYLDTEFKKRLKGKK
ncbi:MAG: hypothetical protein KKH52_00045 [Nanoarchaeota archaeon]|nr:hypothetical protein [Nanoarchaeota archaeon]MBU1622158.1 hypothetical protein [Nanoarchaeota archaeon]MBU1973766.1 hypothetical protein [Nanoarchaeota archaeon]